jgi:hypothetical protein
MTADISEELRQLGKEAARDAWVEHAGVLESVPPDPAHESWLAAAVVLRERGHGDQLDAEARRVFAHAYRGELHLLAAAK